MELKKKIKLGKFIVDNNLHFPAGKKNDHAVILCGYGLYIEVNDPNILIEAVESYVPSPDDGFEEHIKRVFPYAKNNNYGEYWNTDDAKEKYIFS